MTPALLVASIFYMAIYNLGEFLVAVAIVGTDVLAMSFGECQLMALPFCCSIFIPPYFAVWMHEVLPFGNCLDISSFEVS